MQTIKNKIIIFNQLKYQVYENCASGFIKGLSEHGLLSETVAIQL
jgi:hypothetical protein